MWIGFGLAALSCVIGWYATCVGLTSADDAGMGNFALVAFSVVATGAAVLAFFSARRSSIRFWAVGLVVNIFTAPVAFGYVSDLLAVVDLIVMCVVVAYQRHTRRRAAVAVRPAPPA
jgi:hypothetical protein